MPKAMMTMLPGHQALEAELYMALEGLITHPSLKLKKKTPKRN